MKNLHSYKGLLSILFLLIVSLSCNNDFEVNAPFKDIPVVHGILSKSDANHYIRLERAFAEPGVDAFQLAKDPDKLYYPETTTVRLIDIDGSGNEQQYDLVRVKGEDEGIYREEGVFVSAPNYLYKLQGDQIDLNPNHTYVLEIDRGGGLPLVTAQTKIVGDMVLSAPNQFSDFISFDPSIPTFLSLRDEPQNAKIFDFLFTIRVTERRTDNNETNEKVVEWLAISESPKSTNVQLDGIDFFSFMAGSFDANPLIVRRIAGIDLKVTAAGPDLKAFRDVLKANQGITGAEDNIPNYSNLSEGLGLFTSRNFVEVKDLFLPANSLDSLIKNSLTRDLNFVK